MLLKNKRPADNGNMINQFNQFKQEIQRSGKNPQQILNDLISSGKVSNSQLNEVVNKAKIFSYLLK